MSERDRKHYYEVKSDPVRYAKYLKRKAKEQRDRNKISGYGSAKKARWRAENPDKARALRRAHHEVEWAIDRGELVRPNTCDECGVLDKIEAHHHLGYEPEHWLHVQWLCSRCHAVADTRRRYPEEGNA